MILFGEILSVPRCDRRPLIVRIGPILVLLALPACDDGLGDVQTDGGAGVIDAGRIVPPGPDAGASTDGGGIDASFDPLFSEDVGQGCFNGLDDNDDEIIDCQDTTACGATAYCCVGNTSAQCCVLPGASISANFATCASTDPRACAAGAPFSWFGTPTPTIEGIEGKAFVPNGDQIDDSGLILGGLVDPTRERVTLRATIEAPEGGCAGCLDVVALGLADPISGSNVRVVPDVALMVRASRSDVALIVHGAVVAEAPLADALPHVYELVTSPDGSVSLSVDGGAPLTARMSPRPGRAPLLYGRTHNRDGRTEPTRAFDVQLRTDGCDMPSSLERDISPIIPFVGVDWGPRVTSNPSIVPDGADTLVAFTLDQNIHLARRSADGSWALGGSGRVDAPVLTAGVNERLSDPELVREADRFVLYVTREPGEGVARIARAVGNPGHAETFGALTDVMLPADAGPARSPSVVDDGVRRMAVRTEYAGESVIALLNATDGNGDSFGWPADGSLQGSIIVEPNEDFIRFDHDEVSDPELVLDGGGLLRLYYAGRRGTRWSIGVRVSGDRLTFREPTQRAVLAGSGEGHDSLWTRHPTASIRGGAVEIFYTASDGARLDIGRALGSAR